MSTQKIGRREATRRALIVLGSAAFAPALLSGCGGGALECTDTMGLTEAEVVARTSQHYTDAAPGPDRCATCRFFTTAGESACGTCQVLKGPINPQGYCDLWSAAA